MDFKYNCLQWRQRHIYYNIIIFYNIYTYIVIFAHYFCFTFSAILDFLNKRLMILWKYLRQQPSSCKFPLAFPLVIRYAVKRNEFVRILGQLQCIIVMYKLWLCVSSSILFPVVFRYAVKRNEFIQILVQVQFIIASIMNLFISCDFV